MELIVAKNAGACYGVTRSLDIVKKAAKDSKKTATLGELIHNPLVVSSLKTNYGVISFDNVDQAKKNNVDRLIIRSHGVPLDIVKDVSDSGIEIVDATCPYVKNVASAASLLASLYPAVVIIGKTGHPEVETVSSYIKAGGASCFVGETKNEIDKFLPDLLALDDLVGVVSQTTQNVEVFQDMLKYLEENGVKVEVENTICVATKKRQQSAIELSKKVDAMIVLGGHNSSNTNHLADLCRINCLHVYHVESIDEINLSEIRSYDKVGLTAGASTPNSQIEQIAEKLAKK